MCGYKTHIKWCGQGLGKKHFKHLIKISEGIPEGMLDDHGVQSAASQVALRIFGRKEIAHLANGLDCGETAHALEWAGWRTRPGQLLPRTSACFSSKKYWIRGPHFLFTRRYQAVDLKKAIGGETLTINHSGTKASITALGHGQGDSLAKAIRNAQTASANQATAPSPAPANDFIARLNASHPTG